jgi:hypothetical protein
LPVEGTTNVDWEEISTDHNGNIFIGDIGNNQNIRKDLCIYKYSLKSGSLAKINFSYPDQYSFPPSRKEKNFDCEAFFFLKDSLYLISKNRGNKCTHIYQIPAEAGNHKAILKQTLFMNAMITGAAYNDELKECALVSYGKIYFLNLGKDNLLHPYVCKKFVRSGQAEAIVYKNNRELIVTNEGGKIFLVKRN